MVSGDWPHGAPEGEDRSQVRSSASPATGGQRPALQGLLASELYISVNTVKTHLKSIYRKLAANHRTEAVRRAKQLRLI